ncbi:fibropellin-1-like isoform X2 [Watersipora subatra]|uniref:fibropellin-1-like isoform X2 n=1 Tax=Watersipora subatra TaxID=2589382 RepID=UPI00355B8D45
MALNSPYHLPSHLIVLVAVVFSSCLIRGQSQLCNGSFCLGGSCVTDPSNGTESCSCGVDYPSCVLGVTDNCTDLTGYCLNNSTCEISNQNEFRCICAAGYTGERCELELCESSYCYNRGQCILQANGTKTCECDACYVGSPQCLNIVIDLCTNQNWTHDCHPDNTSPNCSTICNSQTNFPEQFCNCKAEFGGSECRQDIDECQQTQNNKHLCNNHGTCINLYGGYECNCDTGWTGDHCESDINECTSGTASCNGRNTASCNNTEGSYLCICNEGYGGDTCDQPDCTLSELCSGHGTCQSNDTDWSCDCNRYYRGRQCEIEGPCLSDPCVHGSCEEILVNGTWEHFCDCDAGWSNSSNCNDNIDECNLQDPPCQNGAECTDTEGNFTCNCTQYWTGYSCDVDVNECEDSPCGPGVCINLEGSYTCNCSGTERLGDHCEKKDWCSVSGVCSDRGKSCVNLPDRANCTCEANYYGLNCSVMDPCQSNPCLNGGTCMPDAPLADSEYVNTNYSCVCTVNYDGQTCGLAAANPNLAVMIAVPIVAVLALACIIGVAVCFVMARKKRATRGRYSPSRTEIIGPNLQMSGVLKQPPEERLI